MENVDEKLEEPTGVAVEGIIYGGRDSDTSLPVEEALSWEHGVVLKGASLESETTAATLGQEGVRVFNPMSNMDFLSIPVGTYIKNHLQFARAVTHAPTIFASNYFLKDKDGKFLNAIEDKRVWLQWMRQRVTKEVSALRTPTGLIPCYEDLKRLFKDFLNKDYSSEAYTELFTLRIPQNLAKIERIRNIYSKLSDIPQEVFAQLDEQEKRLKECQQKCGDYVVATEFNEEG